MNPVVLWLAEAVLSYAVKLILKKLGEPEVRVKFEKAVEKAQPLTPDPNPTIIDLRNPNQRKLLDG